VSANKVRNRNPLCSSTPHKYKGIVPDRTVKTRAAGSTAGEPARSAGQPDALFRAAADQAPQPMWIVNAKGAVTYLNYAWYELVGGTPPQWYGHEWGEVVEPQDLADMRERWKTASATGSIFEGTRRVKAQDGLWHTLAYRATPVFDSGGLACWVGIDSDITELTAQKAALRMANQELQTFSYTVSHDLRSPLVTVQGFSRLLSKELGAGAGEKVSHYLERISEGVDHMGRLVDGLLALSHVTRSKLQFSRVDVSEMAGEILARFQRADPGRTVAVEVQEGLRARADSRLMASLLENLLGNAWKFSSATDKARISVGRAAQSTTEVVLFVKDNGAGFDMAHAGQLFGAFERLHKSSEFPGMGIGLATVHRIVDRHGGRVWAESAPGQGACFYIALPQA
jgi:PAS domain S-box-containing protein